MKKTRWTLLLLLLCVTLLTACGQTPSVPDESVPQDVSVSSTTTTEITTTTEETTTTTEETTTTTAVEVTTTTTTATATTTTARPITTTTTKEVTTTTTTATATTTTARPITTTTTKEVTTTTTKNTTTTNTEKITATTTMAEKITSTTSATKYTTLVPPYDQNPTYAAKPEEDPPQEKHQFRYSFDGQDILLSYTRGVYEDWKLLWYYEGTAKTGEKVIAKVSAEKGYVKTISYEEELSGKRGPFDREEGCKMLLAKMPDVEEVQATKNFLGSGEYYGPNYKTPPPFLTASLSLTDQKINVTCYWSGALYDGTFRVTSFFVKEDRNKNPKVVEESALDFIYPQWV